MKPEYILYLRLCILIIEKGHTVLSKLIENILHKRDMTFIEHLDDEDVKHGLSPAHLEKNCCAASCRTKIFSCSKRQWESLYKKDIKKKCKDKKSRCYCSYKPKSKVCVCDLDISLCCRILLHTMASELNEKSRLKIEVIKEERNTTIAHGTKAYLSETEFAKRWSVVEEAITVLAREQSIDLREEIVREMGVIKTETIFHTVRDYERHVQGLLIKHLENIHSSIVLLSLTPGETTSTEDMYKTLIGQYRNQLVEDLNFSNMSEELLKSELLTKEQYLQLKSEPTRAKRIEHLLDSLDNAAYEKYETFFQVLRQSGHDKLVERMTEYFNDGFKQWNIEADMLGTLGEGRVHKVLMTFKWQGASKQVCDMLSGKLCEILEEKRLEFCQMPLDYIEDGSVKLCFIASRQTKLRPVLAYLSGPSFVFFFAEISKLSEALNLDPRRVPKLQLQCAIDVEGYSDNVQLSKESMKILQTFHAVDAVEVENILNEANPAELAKVVEDPRCINSPVVGQQERQIYEEKLDRRYHTALLLEHIFEKYADTEEINTVLEKLVRTFAEETFGADQRQREGTQHDYVKRDAGFQSNSDSRRGAKAKVGKIGTINERESDKLEKPEVEKRRSISKNVISDKAKIPISANKEKGLPDKAKHIEEGKRESVVRPIPMKRKSLSSIAAPVEPICDKLISASEERGKPVVAEVIEERMFDSGIADHSDGLPQICKNVGTKQPVTKEFPVQSASHRSTRGAPIIRRHAEYFERAASAEQKASNEVGDKKILEDVGSTYSRGRRETLSRASLSRKDQGHMVIYPERLKDETARKYRILLIGKTGTGKSSTGNTLLKSKELFKTKISASSETDCCNVESTHLDEDNITLEVVDSPGSFDTRFGDRDYHLDILTESTTFLAPGFHVIMLVIAPDRFTPEDNESLGSYVKWFGDDVFNHLLIVITKSHDLRRNGKTVNEYIETHPKESLFMYVYQKCDKRAISIENNAEGAERESQHAEIMKEIHQIVEKNQGRHFKHQLFDKAQEKKMERENELRNSYTRAQVAKLRGKLQKHYGDDFFSDLEKQLQRREKIKNKGDGQLFYIREEEETIKRFGKPLSASDKDIVNEAVEELKRQDEGIPKQVKQEIRDHESLFKTIRNVFIRFYYSLKRK